MSEYDIEEDDQKKSVALLPTLEDYQRRYASSLGDNDQKAVGVYKSYEPHEKLRRLQAELMWVKNEQVRETTCDRIIGKKRKSKYRSYEHWASLMLMWISAIKS